MDLSAIESELASPSMSVNLAKHDEVGYCPIHSACCLGMKNAQNNGIALTIVRKLLAAGDDAAALDSKGSTPLHWAARSGAKLIAELLLNRGSSPGELFVSCGILE
jgi:ankyrin repeat protein